MPLPLAGAKAALLRPSSRSAFRFATSVVLVTVNGAVPVATVEMKRVPWIVLLPVMVPVTPKLPVILVASCSSMVPAELSTMLPEVVVVRFRLLLVELSAVAPMLTADRLFKLVVA